MWIVARYKPNELKLLKECFFKILGEMPEFYNPKVKYERYVNNRLKMFQKNILDNYLICKHDNFNDARLVNALKNSRGLVYFLQGYKSNQRELDNFVKFCKSNEDKNGFLKQSFFRIIINNKAKFTSGPFTQMIFEILEDKGRKLKILLNNIKMTIPKQSGNFLYSHI